MITVLEYIQMRDKINDRKIKKEISWITLLAFFIASLIALAFSIMGVMFMVEKNWIN